MRAATFESVSFLTVGHSTHDMETFLRLLSHHRVDALVDLRSTPFSRQAPQFNKDRLRHAVSLESIRYTYVGDLLGGRPADTALYGEDGKVLYWKMAETEDFKQGIAVLWRLLEDHGRVALMCSEEDPSDCHRRLLVGRVLCDEGAQIVHIRGDGRLEEETGVPQYQRTLFGAQEEPGWKSIRSVLPRRAPASSSQH
jgi:uncharacterized protein (DUF488 family)